MSADVKVNRISRNLRRANCCRTDRGSRRERWKPTRESESRELPGGGKVTVRVLITAAQTALALSRSSPSICAFPDSLGSSKPPSHCRIVTHHHWLPWRNSPPGLQGTRVYCLWLLYLDENMICWKGSTRGFFSLSQRRRRRRRRSSRLSSSVSVASINAAPSREAHCFHLLLSRSLPLSSSPSSPSILLLFFFFAHVCVRPRMMFCSN